MGAPAPLHLRLRTRGCCVDLPAPPRLASSGSYAARAIPRALRPQDNHILDGDDYFLHKA
jgi:hypothetical protein